MNPKNGSFCSKKSADIKDGQKQKEGTGAENTLYKDIRVAPA